MQKVPKNATDSHTLPSRIGLEGAIGLGLVYLHLRALSPLVQPLVAMQRQSAQNGPKCALLMGISWVLNSQQMLTTLRAIIGANPYNAPHRVASHAALAAARQSTGGGDGLAPWPRGRPNRPHRGHSMGHFGSIPAQLGNNCRAKCPNDRALCPILPLSQSQAAFVSISRCFPGISGTLSQTRPLFVSISTHSNLEYIRALCPIYGTSH